MTRTTEHLTRCLQAVYQFSLSRQSRLEDLSEVTQSLDKISKSINTLRLSCQIFSQYTLLAEGLHNFFNAHQDLRQLYQFNLSELPLEIPSTQSRQTLSLVLKANSTIGQSETRYDLFPTQSIVMGRDLQPQINTKSIQISLPLYKKVSGRHAEVQPVESLGSSVFRWQICDLGSTNGTYVNGQKVKGCQLLDHNDSITLAYSEPSEKAPEFIFEGQSVLSSQDSSNSSLINGDLIFLVINPKQALSGSEKQLITQISKAQVTGFIVVADISGLGQQDNSQVNTNLAAVKAWVQNRYSQLAEKLEIVPLSLHTFYPNIAPSPLTPAVQQQLAQFCEPLFMLATTQGEDILVRRISRQLQLQIQRIEQVLSTQEKVLNAEVQRTATTLQERTLDYWREHFTRAIKQVAEERDEFFRQARSEVGKASNDFASDIIPDNLMQKVENYVGSLEPIVSKLQGQVGIQLQSSDRMDLHQTMLQFCQIELSQWGEQVWDHFCNELSSEGLQGLLKRSYGRLDSLPNFQFTNTFNSSLIKLDFNESLSVSFTDIKTDISYSESSGDAFGGIAKIAMMSASAAISIGASGGKSISPVAIMQGVNAASALVGLVGTSVSRPKQQQMKLEQVIDSLRRTTCNHYQKIARYLLGKVIQEISLSIDAAERSFRKSLEGIDEQFRGYLGELNNISEGYKMRQQMLYQDRQAFEQIKQLGG